MTDSEGSCVNPEGDRRRTAGLLGPPEDERLAAAGELAGQIQEGLLPGSCLPRGAGDPGELSAFRAG